MGQVLLLQAEAHYKGDPARSSGTRQVVQASRGRGRKSAVAQLQLQERWKGNPRCSHPQLWIDSKQRCVLSAYLCASLQEQAPAYE